MERTIIKDFERWKKNARRKPLLLTGVRQCGKTYIVDEFARSSFKSYVRINFESEEKLSAIFDYDFDVNRIVKELERHFKTQRGGDVSGFPAGGRQMSGPSPAILKTD